MRCAECGNERAVDEFYRDRSRPRGRVARCKQCYSTKQRRSRGPRRLFTEAKYNALRRGIAWELTFDDYVAWIWGAPCCYCGDPKTPHGIDRINNEPFYVITNTVSCCKWCNRAKSSMTLHQFLLHMNRIVDNLSL